MPMVYNPPLGLTTTPNHSPPPPLHPGGINLCGMTPADGDFAVFAIPRYPPPRQQCARFSKNRNKLQEDRGGGGYHRPMGVKGGGVRPAPLSLAPKFLRSPNLDSQFFFPLRANIEKTYLVWFIQV